MDTEYDCKRFHISIAPRLILQLHRDQGKPFKFLLEGIGEDVDEIDIEIQLLQDIKAGKVYTIGDCDNRNERGACMGHESKKTPERSPDDEPMGCEEDKK